MDASLLDGVVGEDENHDVKEPGKEKKQQSHGLVGVGESKDRDTEQALQDQDCGHSQRVGKGTTVGPFDKMVDQNRVGEMIKDERSQENDCPVMRSEGAGCGPEMELVVKPSRSAENDLRDQCE